MMLGRWAMAIWGSRMNGSRGLRLLRCAGSMTFDEAPSLSSTAFLILTPLLAQRSAQPRETQRAARLTTRTQTCSTRPQSPCAQRPFTVHENVVVQTVAVATATLPLAGGFVGIIPALKMIEP
eukprot:5082984-Pleurochrysis_carterae.AAC.1